MTVAGRKIRVIEKDNQGKPDVARAQLASAYADDNADIAVGPVPGVALAMLPIAEEYEKILLVEPAVADSITGDKWNKYIFRTGRNSSQDAIANAVAFDQEGTSIAMLAQDYAFGRDGVKAFKGALKHAKIVHEEYLPANATDFTAGAQRLFDALKDKPGRKIIFILWAGAGNPFKIADLDPKRYGIEIATGGNTLAAMTPLKSLAGMEGATYYYYGIPKNPVNDWLVTEHQKRFGQPPDFFTAGGMSAGIAIVQALNKTQGKSDTDALIKAMEGMSFDTPKGKMTFRPQDHRAMQSMYHFRIKNDASVPWAVQDAVREITPVQNKRKRVATHARNPSAHDPFRRARSRRQCQLRLRARHLDGHRRPQRRGQDHVLQPDLRPVARQRRLGAAERPRPDRTVRAGPHACGPGPGLPADAAVPAPERARERAAGAAIAPAGPGWRQIRFWRTWDDDRALIARADELLERTRLSARRDHIAADLPHGDQRKLEIAMLIALEPQVFMFDEPTAGMSVDDVPVVLDLIREIKTDRSKTILLVEHKMDVVRELADRIVVLHNGRLMADGEPAEVIASPIVQQAYLGVAPTEKTA